MDTIEIVREFLGWCAVINIGVLLLSVVLIFSLRGAILSLHGKMFNLDETFLSQAYFKYLGYYKIAIIMFNVVPYFALMIMS